MCMEQGDEMCSSRVLVVLLMFIATLVVQVKGDCSLIKCLNGGVCQNTTGNCSCVGGWGGLTCRSNINVCAVSTPCLNFATCEDKNDTFVCHCLVGFSGSDCSKNNGMTVACHSSGKMVVTIDLIVMPFIDYTRTHLNSESCIGALDDTNLIIETSLAACETVSSQNSTHVKYQNNVFSYVIDVFPWITRMYNMKLPFYCIFPRINLHVHNGIYLDPRKGVVTLEDGANSNYTLQMSLYKDSAYTSLVTSFPYAVNLHIPLYFKVELITNDPNLAIFVDSCKATANSSMSSTPSFQFLSGGCKTTYTVVYNHALDKESQRFRVDSFRFTKVGARYVYVHCYIGVCLKSTSPTKCDTAPTCSSFSRRKRSAIQAGTEKTLVSLGPLNYPQNEAGARTQTTDVIIPVTATAAVLAVMLVCSIIAAIVFKCRRRQHGKINSAKTHKLKIVPV